MLIIKDQYYTVDVHFEEIGGADISVAKVYLTIFVNGKIRRRKNEFPILEISENDDKPLVSYNKRYLVGEKTLIDVFDFLSSLGYELPKAPEKIVEDVLKKVVSD